MDRRTFVAGTFTIVVASRISDAQQARKIARVGFLVVARNPGVESAFPRGLAELGYVEGSSLLIDWRSADGSSDKLMTLAAELVQTGAKVIVAAGPEARIAAMKATATVPIVAVGGTDPVSEGWAASLARPGGNVTGFTVTYPELMGKKLELLKQLIPALSRVAVLSDPDANPPSARAEADTIMRDAARALSIDITAVGVRSPADFDAAFRAAIRHRCEALAVVETAMLFAHRADIADRARSAKLPTIGEWKPSASAGFLASYGADLSDLLRRAAIHVDKILKGAKPGSLPIERPTKFEFVVNLKTAKALGVRIPPAVLPQVDQVIE